MPTIVEMLEKNAQKYPDDVALIELTPSQNIRKQLTWKEFDEQANRIANYLLQKGIKKGDKVIHWMRNSAPWLVAYFGIIKTGAWAVPLNFRFNAKDFKFCTDIAEAKAIIFEDYFLNIVQETKPCSIKEYIYLGPNLPAGMASYDDILRSASNKNPEIKLTANDECGLYFTSGTTGDPKPVLLTHKNMSFAAEVE
jgi:acyl-CoA synthetase (AMP-forming)/AMP-acid ligase II